MATLAPGEKARMYALSGVFRSGASRSGYVARRVVISIGGILIGNSDTVGTTPGVLVSSLTIHDALNETPNTATFTVRGPKPADGAEVIIALGSLGASARLFAGHIIRSTQVYFETPRAPNFTYHVECTDYTWLVNQRIISARYRNASASFIALDLVIKYVPGFTGNGIAPDLPAIDEITMTNVSMMDALLQIADRVGGYAAIDYFRDVHLWADADPAGGANPPDLVPSHCFTEFSAKRDLSQIVTRALVEGGGVNALAPVAPGSTILPVDDAAWYPTNGAIVVSGPQRIQYAAVTVGGSGSLVGPGVVPASAPTALPASGGAIEIGAHSYAYTWVTPTGETLPSPVAAVTLIGAIAPGTTAPLLANDNAWAVDERTSGAWKPGDLVDWAYSYSAEGTIPNAPVTYDPNTTLLSPIGTIAAIAASSFFQAPGYSAQSMRVYAPLSLDPNVKFVFVWHRVNGGPWRQWGAGFWNAPTSGGGSPGQPTALYTFMAPAQYSAVKPIPTQNPTYRSVKLSGIAPGAAPTSSRKVYRTAANAAPLRLLTTIADNTTTTYTDNAADATLGALAPVTDTSGIAPKAGQVNQGSTSLLVVSADAFPVPGYAVIGNGQQTIYYTGKTATTLTGIPASGDGSITATVQYGSSITVAPMLTGIPASGDGSILWAILQGDPVNVFVMLDDGAAQAALRALIGGTGVQEHYQQDRRISYAEATARARALLDLRRDVRIAISYRCRDRQTRTGRTVTVNLPPPTNVAGTFLIQDVQIGKFTLQPHTWPEFTVSASSARYTFEDLLRQARISSDQG